MDGDKVVGLLSQKTNFFAQSTQKGTQEPGGKNNEGKKGKGGQNKQKPIGNAKGGKKDKNKVKFPCKLCQEDHLTYQCPLMKQAHKLLKEQQPVILKDPFPQEQNATSSDPKNVGGTQNALAIDQSYINMSWSHTLLQTRAKNYETGAS